MTTGRINQVNKEQCSIIQLYYFLSKPRHNARSEQFVGISQLRLTLTNNLLSITRSVSASKFRRRHIGQKPTECTFRYFAHRTGLPAYSTRQLGRRAKQHITLWIKQPVQMPANTNSSFANTLSCDRNSFQCELKRRTFIRASKHK